MVALGVPLDKSAPGTDLKRAFFVDLDVNGDGRISLDEFLATVEKRTNHITSDASTAWQEILKFMDRNGVDASYMFERVRVAVSVDAAALLLMSVPFFFLTFYVVVLLSVSCLSLQGAFPYTSTPYSSALMYVCAFYWGLV